MAKERPTKTRETAAKANAAALQLELELVKFRTGRSDIEFNVDITQETVWASQNQMAALFDVDRTVITKHLQNIFDSKELDEATISAEFAHVGTTGQTYRVKHYNLDAILSVGYRVNSDRATKFRQWATQTLRAYIVDGYAINHARLRDDPQALKALAAKIRALRAEEKNVYASVRECFKEAASDYNPNAAETRKAFAMLQDKFHYAVTSKTASQIILDRADHKHRNMGLQTLDGERPTLAEATIAKNYLDGDELYALHLICEQFLLFAESKALRGQTMTMQELSKKLDALLATNEYPVFRGYKDALKDRAVRHAQVELALYLRRVGREPSAPAVSR